MKPISWLDVVAALFVGLVLSLIGLAVHDMNESAKAQLAQEYRLVIYSPTGAVSYEKARRESPGEYVLPDGTHVFVGKNSFTATPSP